MKKLFAMMAVAGALCLASCNNDDAPETSAHPWAKSYRFAPYTTGTLTYNDYTNENAVIGGAGYVNYVYANGDQDYGCSYGCMFRGMFGVILPQVLQSVTLERGGDIRAVYNPGSEIRFETMWAFQAPTVEEAAALVPTTGWEKSPAKMARWAERDGRLVVTLDLAQIIAASVGPDADAEALTQVVMQVLDSDAATIKGLIASLLGVESIAISDETIEQLVGWVKNGIPLRVKEEDGHTRFYLGKEEFATLFKLRTYDDGAQSSDIANLLTLLGDAGMLPPEASMAGMLTNVISTGWDATESFEMGLDLVSE